MLHKKHVSILTSTITAARDVCDFCETKSKSNIHLDIIMEDFFLTALFIEKTPLKFQREHCFPVRMEAKLKEVLGLGPHGANTTEALVNAWVEALTSQSRGGCHFCSFRCKSSCPHPHPAPQHEGHVNPSSNQVLHPRQESHILSSEGPSTGSDSGHCMCRCAACVCTCAVAHVLGSYSCHPCG